MRRGGLFLNLGLIFLVGMCLAITHQPVFSKLYRNWSSADNNYCFIIIPLFIYLCWDRRIAFQFNRFNWSPWGFVLLLTGIGIIFVGELGSVITLLHIGTWGCIVSLLTTLYGQRIRHLAFPVIILFFITPLPDLVNQVLAYRFKMAAGSLAAMMLRLSGVSVFQAGNVIDLGITHLEVNQACSGLRYLIPLLILTLLIGYFFYSRFVAEGCFSSFSDTPRCCVECLSDMVYRNTLRKQPVALG